jgi:hypothetical protein
VTVRAVTMRAVAVRAVRAVTVRVAKEAAVAKRTTVRVERSSGQCFRRSHLDGVFP